MSDQNTINRNQREIERARKAITNITRTKKTTTHNKHISADPEITLYTNTDIQVQQKSEKRSGEEESKRRQQGERVKQKETQKLTKKYVSRMYLQKVINDSYTNYTTKRKHREYKYTQERKARTKQYTIHKRQSIKEQR